MRWSAPEEPPDGLERDDVVKVVEPGLFAPTGWAVLVEQSPSTTGLDPNEVLGETADGRTLRLPGRSLTLLRPELFLEPEADIGPAQWMLPSSPDPGRVARQPRVSTFIPPSLHRHCYLLLHPWRGTDASRTGSLWREVAHKLGATHPGALVEGVQGPEAVRHVPGYLPPLEGEIDVAVARPLLQELSAATGSLEEVFAAVWDGWADLPAQWIRGAATLTLAQSRQHLLFRGPRAALLNDLRASDQGASAVPGVWWPEDRAWIVYSDIDYPWSFVATRYPMDLDRIGRDLELLPVDPTLAAARVLHA